MLKLYCFPRSGNSREVKIVLAEKGVPYESINAHAEGFDRENPEFKKASTFGKVPAIIDGSVYMSEAYRINEYLEDKYPQSPLLPKEESQRAKILGPNCPKRPCRPPASRHNRPVSSRPCPLARRDESPVSRLCCPPSCRHHRPDSAPGPRGRSVPRETGFPTRPERKFFRLVL